MAPSSAAQWFAAVATSLAVVVALFKDFFWEWWRKPKLVATCEDSPPSLIRTPLFANNPASGQPPWTGESYWVRLKVNNEGRTRADNVQVEVSQVRDD
jgi:hypothetical protein